MLSIYYAEIQGLVFRRKIREYALSSIVLSSIVKLKPKWIKQPCFFYKNLVGENLVYVQMYLVSFCCPLGIYKSSCLNHYIMVSLQISVWSLLHPGSPSWPQLSPNNIVPGKLSPPLLLRAFYTYIYSNFYWCDDSYPLNTQIWTMRVHFSEDFFHWMCITILQEPQLVESLLGWIWMWNHGYGWLMIKSSGHSWL